MKEREAHFVVLFNSLQFAVFFAVVFAAYARLGHRGQNLLLLAASYLFYGAWDYRFLSLIVFSTLVDYYLALGISASEDPRRRKLLLWLSMVTNLGLLAFFKYYGFFVDSLETLLSPFMGDVSLLRLDIVLPVGISFYTFQTMSYTIDVYRRELTPTRHFLDFALFVSFFPQLVAGPIERASHLLPQMLQTRTVTRDGIVEGLYYILWGLFLKVFVADNLAAIVNPIYAQNPPANGAAVLVATYAFAFQIFGDFAGYSFISKGVGRCMGFDIMTNFNLPYFSANPSEFWRRWHISLSTWLRDYLYIPLGGNRFGSLFTYRNLILTMLLGGLWHGAAWNFVAWGAYQGALLAAHRMAEPTLIRLAPRNNAAAIAACRVLSIIVFFQFTCMGWLLFRVSSTSQLVAMLRSLASPETILALGQYQPELIKLTAIAGPLLLLNLVQYYKQDQACFLKMHWTIQALFYYFLIMCIAVFGVFGGSEFIYFQF